MNEKKKLFSDPRWNDTSKPNIIGYIEITEEEYREYHKKFREHLKRIGVIKDEGEDS